MIENEEVMMYKPKEGYKKIEEMSDPYHWKYIPRVYAINRTKIILNNINIKGDIVLDIGCGNGVRITKRIQAKKVVGMDANEEAVKYGKKVFGLEVVVGDVYNLGFKDKAVDTTLLYYIFEHLDRPYEALKEVKRVTKYRAIIVVPNKLSIPHDCYQLFDADRLYNMCSKFGQPRILPTLKNHWIRDHSVISTVVGGGRMCLN